MNSPGTAGKKKRDHNQPKVIVYRLIKLLRMHIGSSALISYNKDKSKVANGTRAYKQVHASVNHAQPEKP